MIGLARRSGEGSPHLKIRSPCPCVSKSDDCGQCSRLPLVAGPTKEAKVVGLWPLRLHDAGLIPG